MNSTRSAKVKHDAHTDARVVMVRPMIVTAGGSFSHAPIQAARLVMAGNPRPIIEGLPGYTPIVVKLDWPDMSTPDMNADDWRWLTGRLRALRRPLHVSCAMGHGRTGTCLAILAHFLGQIPKGADPVAWLRAAYCPDAIETKGQISYIERITGRTSKCKPKEPVMVATSYDYGISGPYTGKNEWGQPYGAKLAHSTTAFKSFPENDASRALATGQYRNEPRVVHRYCGQTTKGIMCPKPAKDGLTLCDVHYFESLPPVSGTEGSAS